MGDPDNKVQQQTTPINTQPIQQFSFCKEEIE